MSDCVGRPQRRPHFNHPRLNCLNYIALGPHCIVFTISWNPSVPIGIPTPSLSYSILYPQSATVVTNFPLCSISLPIKFDQFECPLTSKQRELRHSINGIVRIHSIIPLFPTLAGISQPHLWTYIVPSNSFAFQYDLSPDNSRRSLVSRLYKIMICLYVLCDFRILRLLICLDSSLVFLRIYCLHTIIVFFSDAVSLLVKRN